MLRCRSEPNIFMGINTLKHAKFEMLNPKSSRSLDPQFFHKLLFYLSILPLISQHFLLFNDKDE